MNKRAFWALAGLAGGIGLGAGGAHAQETVDWCGFYAGVFAGYGLDTARATSSTTPPTTVEINPGDFLTIGGSNYNERFEAFFGGLQAGYNHQFDRFVVGVEGAVALGGFDKSRGGTTTINFTDGVDFSNNRLESNTDFSIDWLTTFAGKAGMDFDGWLVYGKAGVAVADLSGASSSTYEADSSGVGGLLGLPDGTYTSSSSTEALRFGGVFGVGVEKMLTENMSLGLEYDYVRLGNIEVSTPGLGGLGGGGGGTETFSANMHTLKASLNYHF